MSIEASIQELSDSINRLIDVLNSLAVNSTDLLPKVAVADLPPTASVPPVEVPKTPPPALAVKMPEPPTFVTPPPPTAPAVPFSDAKGMIDYLMSTYKALGSSKGVAIQKVLLELGYKNANDVKPEHYAELYKGVEALKVA